MTNNDELACNPVISYADSYRSMANQGSEFVPVWGVITDLERNIAPLYAAMLAERDADKKRIADLQHQREEETQRANRADFEGYSRAMRELETRTVSVKLPVVPSQYETLKLCLEPSDGYGMQKGAEYMRDEFIKALAAASIKLEMGE